MIRETTRRHPSLGIDALGCAEGGEADTVDHLDLFRRRSLAPSGFTALECYYISGLTGGR